MGANLIPSFKRFMIEVSWDVAAMVRLANEVKTVAVKEVERKKGKKKLGTLRCQEQRRRKRKRKQDFISGFLEE